MDSLTSSGTSWESAVHLSELKKGLRWVHIYVARIVRTENEALQQFARRWSVYLVVIVQAGLKRVINELMTILTATNCAMVFSVAINSKLG